MNEESTATVPPLRYRNDSASEIENANLSIVPKRMPLHELKQVSFDVRSNYTVRLNHRACF